MTEHYTQEEAVELARENGFNDLSEEYHPMFCQELTTFANAAVTRKLAEKELEVVRLREALDLLRSVVVEHNCRGVDWGDLFGNLMSALGNAAASLSTPTSTKALDEYVAGKVKELKQKCGEFAEESLRNAAKLTAAEDDAKTWKERAEFSYIQRDTLESQVAEGKRLLREQMVLTNERTQDAITLRAKLAAAEQVHDKASKEFNAAINHAISLGLDASVFLYAWREGNWEGCKEFGFERSE